MEIKDPTFAMAVNTTPRPSNNSGYNSYNQSSNEVETEETTTKVKAEVLLLISSLSTYQIKHQVQDL